MVLLTDCANIGDLGHLVVEDCRAGEGGNEGGEHLAVESDPRWDVGIMSEFEILGKVEGVRGGDVSVTLEVKHSSGVTGEPEATEQLGDNIEGDLYVGNGHDDTARNAEDGGEEDTIQRGSGGGVGWVSGDAGGTETNRNTQNDEVDPFRNLSVRPHQAGVNILGVVEGRFTADQVLEPGNHLATVVQSDVGNGSSVGCEVNAIEEAITGSQTKSAT